MKTKYTLISLLLLNISGFGRSPQAVTYQTSQQLLQFAAIFPWTINKLGICIELNNVKVKELKILKKTNCFVTELEETRVLLKCDEHKGQFGFFKSNTNCETFVSNYP